MRVTHLVSIFVAAFLPLLAEGQAPAPPLTTEPPTPQKSENIAELKSEDGDAAEMMGKPAEELQPPQLQSTSLLAESAEPDQIFWLEDDFGKFLTLYQRDNTGNPFGAVLLFHAEGEHPLWPGSLARLFTDLPDNGWNTATASLPNPLLAPHPERDFFPPTAAELAAAKAQDKIESASKGATEAANEESMTEAKETDNKTVEETDKTTPEEPSAELTATEETENKDAEKAMTDESTNDTPESEEQPGEQKAPPPKPRPVYAKLPDPEKTADSRLGAIYGFMHAKGQLNLNFIAVGSSAPRVMSFFDSLYWPTKQQQRLTGAIRPVQTLTLINARNTLPISDTDLAKLFKDPELAVLDIYYGKDLRDKREAKRRISYARRNGMRNYFQIMLPELAGPEQQDNRLVKRIQGFLEKYAKGQEVKAAISQ
ncbi:MAG: alpha/beta hydrolase family protein [Cellvibrionaceae bacterium]